MRRREPDQHGFTLVEILVTVAVLGVLVALAIPSYRNTLEGARANEARTNLQVIRMGQKVYALNNSGDYWNPGASPALATINSTLNIDISTSFYNISSITANNAATPKTFSVIATRNTTAGGNGTSTLTIDQDGTIS